MAESAAHRAWWGGKDARLTLAQTRAQYLPSVLAKERVTPYIAMLTDSTIATPDGRAVYMVQDSRSPLNH